MKNIYYRVSYHGIGIYEAVKKEIWLKSKEPKKDWETLKKSTAFTWLKTPSYYSENCFSYFTKYGFNLFMKNTFDTFAKYLNKKDIVIETQEIEYKNIVYSDEHQIVVENN